MKIAFLNDIIYGYASGGSAVGGAERQQWLLGRALAGKGWSVTVGVRQQLQLGERRMIDGVTFVGIGQGQVPAAWYRFLAAERPDWLYWRCADHLWGVAVGIAKITGVRTIFAACVDSNVEPRRTLGRRRRWWPLFAWGLSRSDRIFVQHSGQLSALNARWRRKAAVVPSIAGSVPAGKPHGLRSPYVAWAAMLRQGKRPDLLLDIARRSSTVPFVVCGGPTTHKTSPEYTDAIVDALRRQPNVEYLGRVSPQKTQQVIGDAAMLLSTSDKEGFPNTFLEAWSSGTPVLTLQIDPDRIIEQRQLGAVVGSVDRAVEQIACLISSPQRREEIASRARRYVQEAHSEAAVIAAFERAIGRPAEGPANIHC